MRIVFSSPRYEPFLGGVETNTRESATRLAARGHDVVVVTTDPKGELPPRERLHDVEVVRIMSRPKRGDPFWCPGAGDAVLGERPEIVHVQSYQSMFSPFVMRACAKHQVPVVMAFHGGVNSNPVREALYPLQRRVLAPLVRKMDGLIVLAPFEIPLYSREFKLPASAFTRIPNGCDLPLPEVMPERDPQLVVSIGRLEPAKGHDRVIRAIATLRRSGEQLCLDIIGKGPDEARLRSLVHQLGLDDVVTFSSFQASERNLMATRLASSTVVVAMSRGETQPIAVMEAARIGCRVLVSDESAGMRDLVEANIVLGVNHDASDEQLAEQILGARRSDFTPDTTSLLTWEQSVDGLEALYERVLQR